MNFYTPKITHYNVYGSVIQDFELIGSMLCKCLGFGGCFSCITNVLQYILCVICLKIII